MKKDISKKKLYEEVGREFRQDKLLDNYHHFRRMNIVTNFMKSLDKNLKVLDLGCGDGWQTNIYGKFFDVTGLDISEVRIKRARNNFPDRKFITGDIYNLELKQKSFDVVLMSELIEHLEEPERALRQAYTVVKDSGYVVIDTPSRSNLTDMFLRLLGRNPMWGLTIDKTHVAFYSQQEVVSLLEKSGFSLIKVKGGPVFRFNSRPFNRWVRNKRRWWILKVIDNTIGSFPYVGQYGTVQIFLFKKGKINYV